MQFTIRQARVYAGLTQAELANELGIDRGTFIRIEKDESRATLGQVNRIAQITGIPTSCFTLGRDSVPVKPGQGRIKGKNRKENLNEA